MIYLRELTSTDVPRVNAWRRDRTLAGGLGSPFRFVGIETDNAWFERYRAQRETNVRLAICLEADDTHIGNVYLLNIDWVVRSAVFHILIGDARHRGKGYGKRATLLALDHAFGDLKLNRVSLSVLAANAPVIGLYEKCGFHREGLARQAAFKNGEYADMLMMAILREHYGLREGAR